MNPLRVPAPPVTMPGMTLPPDNEFQPDDYSALDDTDLDSFISDELDPDGGYDRTPAQGVALMTVAIKHLERRYETLSNMEGSHEGLNLKFVLDTARDLRACQARLRQYQHLCQSGN